MQTCKSMANCPLPCMSYRNFKMFKISASEFGSLHMRRRMRACTDEFLATVNEGVVHGVYKVVTRSVFGVIR